jgi:hypothetical protein
MPRSTTPAGPGPGTTTGNPAISGVGSGMGTAAGPDVTGMQAGTVNDAAQGAGTGTAADPSLGSGMGVPQRGDRAGDAATGGAPGAIGAGGGPASPAPFELPYKVSAASPGKGR